VRAPHAAVLTLIVVLASLLIGAGSASAANFVYTANQDYWEVNDAAIPGVDTGSVETTKTGSLLGFGGIRMQVIGAPKTPRMNGVLMRGFGFTFDGVDSFTSGKSVELGGVSVTRALKIDKAEDYGRFLDTFTNTTAAQLSIDVAFGGQLGGRTDYSGPYYQSAIVASSSGDAAAGTNDSWVEVSTGAPSVRGPVGVVLGTPGAGNLTRTGNWLEHTFTAPLASGGDEGNQYAFINHLTLAPGETKSLLHFVAVGLSETTATPSGGAVPAAGSQLTAVKTAAEALAATPDLSDLTTGQLCSISNFGEAAIEAGEPGWTPAACTSKVAINSPAPVEAEPEATTSSPYDVVGKTITQELGDMETGVTNSQQIVRAYLDRIAAYDQGPFGFHAFITINPAAMAEARQADRLRAEGSKLPLLGIPVAVKDIYDTDEMKTTGGSLVFRNFHPLKDSFLVERLRAAGAIIIGKANLSEFANSGHFSESAFGKVWNAFDPSKSSIGSSGGSAVAVATSMAAAALGTQTGDSLWGPSSAASLVSLRGTDGLTSCQGVMPLTYIQDYCGAITRTPEDQALVLDAIAQRDPADETQGLEGAGWEGRRPGDWRAALDPNALQGKTIGFYPAAFADPFGTTDTTTKLQEEFKYFAAAGASVVQIKGPPSAPNRSEYFTGDTGYEGWLKWIQGEPNSPYATPEEIIDSQLKLPAYRNASPYSGTGAMTQEQIEGFVAYRQAYQQRLAAWMKEEGVDAVVFPGQLSNIHLNDSVAPSFGRLDPQSSNAGVPTAIFPAGTNSDGQPGNLQLEGPAFSDAELLGMAYAFELRAAGHVETSYAPALRYDPDSVAEPVSASPAPPSSSSPPAATKPTEPGPAVIKTKALFKKLKRVTKAGTAFVKVRVSGEGRLVAVSSSVRKVVRRPKAAKSVWIPIRAKGKALATLKKKGHVKVKVKLVFTPAGGAKVVKTRSVTLVKK
jgi:amidase